MKTKDFGLCSLLAANQCEIVRYETDSRGQVWLEWTDDDRSRKLEREFLSGTAIVRLADYLSAQKHIKTLIFNTRRNAYGDGEYELHRNSYSI